MPLKASVLALVHRQPRHLSWLGRHVSELAGLLGDAAAAGDRLGEPTALVAGMVPDRPRAGRSSPPIDVPLQKRLYGDKLKMSHQEVKQENKELQRQYRGQGQGPRPHARDVPAPNDEPRCRKR